jgi:hypothetical protein
MPAQVASDAEATAAEAAAPPAPAAKKPAARAPRARKPAAKVRVHVCFGKCSFLSHGTDLSSASLLGLPNLQQQTHRPVKERVGCRQVPKHALFQFCIFRQGCLGKRYVALQQTQHHIVLPPLLNCAG